MRWKYMKRSDASVITVAAGDLCTAICDCPCHVNNSIWASNDFESPMSGCPRVGFCSTQTQAYKVSSLVRQIRPSIRLINQTSELLQDV